MPVVQAIACRPKRSGNMARAGTTQVYANVVGFDDSDMEIGNDFNGNLNAMCWYGYNDEMVNNFAIAAYESDTKPVAKK
ncbi:MAG: hypothetical protein ACI9J2_002039 [Saprospiraceae bacterium]|jgi:hypothetical protein